jgi:thiol:disulfide interchange protein
MSIVVRLILLWLPLLALTAGEPLATFEKNSVEVVLSYEPGAEAGRGTIVGVFTPKPKQDPLHLYSVDLPGTDGGVPTTIAVRPGQAVEAAGRLTADQTPYEHDGLMIYPDGPVTVRLPVTVPPTSDGAPVETTLLISYMACSAKFCLNPVMKQPVAVKIPTVKAAAAVETPGTGTTVGLDAEAVRRIVDGALAKQKEELVPEIRHVVVAEIDRLHEQASSAIRWRHPTSIAEIERLIEEAKQAGKPALLDFTGPSCVNCQLMDKTVFRVPAVVAAWNRGVPIAINTDPDPRVSDDFSAWQQQRFQTQNRPLYVRIDPDGKEERWSEVFAPGDQATLALFIAFTQGGVGSDAGSGDGIGEFLLLAILGGLFTLLMPCTYPMIPFTMTFFAKQAAGGRRLLPLATFYSLGIIACFVGLGVLITGVFGSTLANLAGHPVTNLVIALLFLVLGLGLLGAFLIRLPAGLENSLGGGRGGYLGALIMGLTFAVTAFSCTAPFAGAVLSQAVVTGSWTRAMIGMAVYASAIAIPFFVLAMSPGLLKKLPKAGAWMNEFKVVGGLVELAAALKFLVICDVAWEWGLIGRSFTLASWAAVSLVIGIYVLGKLRFTSDEPVEQVGVSRLLIALGFLALGLWFASGLAGNNLGLFESFFPGDEVPGA